MKRGDVCWADLGPEAGRRPVVVLTRDSAIPVLESIVVAGITRTIRRILSEVNLGPEDGLPQECVVNCDSIAAVGKSYVDQEPVTRLSPDKLAALDRALRFALGIVF